ncbi:hypothetical protein J3458_004890 [Metarhizium acridum]|uniref:uncharacterized protein n=1 Tax=Metarhizium acridum TaxID=92637 RepID=UPI001C6BA7F9|nr:hypothetical protein J3458_004862 [Metarhizium acridum]KAG8417381.1 hypothetical protein J3458_004890 [Metarhizium acridum]
MDWLPTSAGSAHSNQAIPSPGQGRSSRADASTVLVQQQSAADSGVVSSARLSQQDTWEPAAPDDSFDVQTLDSCQHPAADVVDAFAISLCRRGSFPNHSLLRMLRSCYLGLVIVGRMLKEYGNCVRAS